MNLKESIQTNPEACIALCKRHNVKSLYAFGSSVSEKFNEGKSDIDLLVELNTNDPIRKGEALFFLVKKTFQDTF
jgi:predicted nucleotidyltransferase